MPRQHGGLVAEALGIIEALAQTAHATTESRWLRLDITMMQLKGLFLLYDQSAMTVGGVADALGAGRPAASILIDRLVGLALVERAEDPSDRRRAIVRLSPRGRELVTELQQGEQRLMRARLERLADDDLAALIRGSRALLATMADTNTPAGAGEQNIAPPPKVGRPIHRPSDDATIDDVVQ